MVEAQLCRPVVALPEDHRSLVSLMCMINIGTLAGMTITFSPALS